jgi:hypothetical protein
MGPQDSAAGDWQMSLRTKIGGGCAVRADTCATYYSQGQIELRDNNNVAVATGAFSGTAISITRYDSATQDSYHLGVTWQKSHAYQFHLRLMHTGTSNGTASELWRGGLVIRFNLTP